MILPGPDARDDRRPIRYGLLPVRNALFQLHWLLGLTAGLVLMLVGVTGGILSVEEEVTGS